MNLSDISRLMKERKAHHLSISGPMHGEDVSWRANFRVNNGWQCGEPRSTLEAAVEQVFGMEQPINLDDL